MDERRPWDHDISITPGSVITVDCGGELVKQRIVEATVTDEPIVPRPPMPPWWRPFARRKWRRAPVGPTMPMTRLRTEYPFWEDLRAMILVGDLAPAPVGGCDGAVKAGPEAPTVEQS